MSAKRQWAELTDGLAKATAAADELRQMASSDKKTRLNDPDAKGVGTTAEPLPGGQALYRFKDGEYTVVKPGTLLSVSYVHGDEKDIPGFIHVTHVHSDDGSCDGRWLYSYADIVKECGESVNARTTEFRDGLFAVSDSTVERFDVAYVVAVSTIRVYHSYDVDSRTLTRIGDAALPLTRHEEAFRDFLIVAEKTTCHGDTWATAFGKRVVTVVPLLLDLLVDSPFLRPHWQRDPVSVQGTCYLCKKGKTLTHSLFDYKGLVPLASYGSDCYAAHRRAFDLKETIREMTANRAGARDSNAAIRKKYKAVCYELKLDEEPYETSPILPSALVLAVNTAAAPPMPVASFYGSSSSSSSSAAAAAAH